MPSFSLTSIGLLLGAASVTGAVPSPTPSAGSITGTVTFTGTPPKQHEIDMAKEPSCAKQHATPVKTQTVVAGPNNSVEWVVIYVSAGDKAAGAAPGAAAHYDQKGCEYIPHVAAFQVGQSLEIANDDQTSHNIHPLAKLNPEWNKSQPPGSPPIKTSYAKAEFIPVKCNVHPWMHGYFAVLSTSHYALSGEDGKYTLPDLPPGKYTITAWHEKFGTQSQEITVAGGKPAQADFVFKALPY